MGGQEKNPREEWGGGCWSCLRADGVVRGMQDPKAKEDRSAGEEGSEECVGYI